jgi:ABC-type maltose transport system permease subunit
MLMTAVGMLVTVPVLILFVFVQRHLLQGSASGSDPMRRRRQVAEEGVEQ